MLFWGFVENAIAYLLIAFICYITIRQGLKIPASYTKSIEMDSGLRVELRIEFYSIWENLNGCDRKLPNPF